MKKFRKLLAALMLAVLALPMFAYIHTDIGIILKDENGKMVVYKEIYVDENKLEALSDKEMIKIVTDKMSMSKEWKIVGIDKYQDKAHFVGDRMEAELPSAKKNDVSILLAVLANGDGEYYYNTKTSIGSKKTTIRIKPSKKQILQLYDELSGYGKGETDEYCIVIEAPTKVLSTNGKVESDGRTVRFDVKDDVLNEKDITLYVKYFDFGSIVVAILVVAALAGGIYFLIKRKKTKDAEKAAFTFVPTDDDDLLDRNNANSPLAVRAEQGEVEEGKDYFTPGMNESFATFANNPSQQAVKRCPECGEILVDNGTYCEKCGMFF